MENFNMSREEYNEKVVNGENYMHNNKVNFFPKRT